ncbi:MAG TPA: acyl-CoA dehydrogenase family protein [Candidatus Limnocylindrales bacterium]|nr:acyl-CoA dehydrogenase family protein [Candidatus Limnocylindrales bacterium]
MDRETLRADVRALCERLGGAAYWRALDPKREYPEAFARAFAEARYLAALIPPEYGGLGLSLGDTSVIVEEINHAGGNAGTAHAQLYTMGTLLRWGSEEQKRAWLPRIASGEVRLQAFGVTEPVAGVDTTRITTTAERRGDVYVANGRKRWTSRYQHSDAMLLLARTGPATAEDRGAGLSVFLVDLRALKPGTIEVTPIPVSMNNETNEIAIRDLEIPVANLIGEEGRGFRYIIDGWNAERILIAAECVGHGRFLVERASAYVTEREVFGKPLGANQSIQFPIARAHAALEAADLVRRDAADRFDRGEPCGPQANMAKLLASEASWQAANAAIDAFGGNGFAADYDVERIARETRLYTVAPLSNNLILAYLGHKVLGMPRST